MLSIQQLYYEAKKLERRSWYLKNIGLKRKAYLTILKANSIRKKIDGNETKSRIKSI